MMVATSGVVHIWVLHFLNHSTPMFITAESCSVYSGTHNVVEVGTCLLSLVGRIATLLYVLANVP